MHELDVVVSGLVFQDLVLGLPTAPRPGTEVWATESHESPGGIANFAVALARLGLRTGMAAAFGADADGDRVWTYLTAEGIDLTLSRRLAGWQTPLTVALAYDNDRALVTRGTPPLLSADELITTPPAARAVAAHIGSWPNEWLAKAKAAGSVVFADVGWDPTEQWDPAVLDQLQHCDVFLPNAEEAMHYTRTDSPEHAMRQLAERVRRWWSCPTALRAPLLSTRVLASRSPYLRMRFRRRTPPGRVMCSPPVSSPPRSGSCHWQSACGSQHSPRRSRSPGWAVRMPHRAGRTSWPGRPRIPKTTTSKR